MAFKSYVLTGTVLAGIVIPTAAQSDDFSSVFDKDRFQVRARAVAVLADGDGTENVTGLNTDVGNAITPEVDLTYFFTRNIAAEVIAGTAQHQIFAGASDIGETWILPPTVTLQYHFQPQEKFSPYIGAGINYSYFYGEDDGTGFDNLDVEGGWGYALQAGADYWINDNWGLNIDMKYIDLEVDVDVDAGGTALSADDVDLNPVIFGVGVSYRF